MAFLRTVLISSLALALSGCGSDEESKTTNNPPTTPKGTPDLPPLPEAVTLPIVFVHGFAGSAQQYESQTMRFVANGYPRERIRAIDHDGQGATPEAFAEYSNLVDGLVNEVRGQFGVEKVYLVGHSRGTAVSNLYMGDPARAAKVAKYISLDGGGCAVADGIGIPCLAPTQACRPDAVNCVPMPGQAHVEVATSATSFVEQYKFLVGEDPAVVDIVRQDGPVELRGRAVNFPANTGRAGTTLEIYEIDSNTGKRSAETPIKTFSIGDDGEWGPTVVSPDKHYEMTLVAETGDHHFYTQRYLRSSHLVRLLSGPPDSPIRLATNRGANHTAIIAMRMREWYGTNDADLEGDDSDILEISTNRPGATEPPVNAISADTGNSDIAIHIHDDLASPGESKLGALDAVLHGGAFQTSADVFMPAADPPDGTITVKNIPRADGTKPQVLNFPNWVSDGHIITVFFADYAQE